MRKHASPYDGKTSNWRAVCGKSACTVRREGERGNRSPYPYPIQMEGTACPAVVILTNYCSHGAL
jgi:hypothetical protein